MSLSPINFNGMIQSTAEIGNIKSHEDSRPEVNHANIQVVVDQQEEHESHSVSQLEEKSEQYDLGDGQSNSYRGGNRKKKQKKEEKKEPDGVVRKKDGHSMSFDISV